jgi:hypothetical protein
MKPRALFLALLMLGCGGKPPAPKKDTPPPPPKTQAEEPPKTQASTAPATAPGAATSDATLSLVEPAEGRCQWVRLDPVAKRREVLAAIEGPCEGALVAFQKGGPKALFRFDPYAVYSSSYGAPGLPKTGFPEEKPIEGMKPRLYEVDGATGKVQALPEPAPGQLEDFGYNPKGEAIALTGETSDPKIVKEGGKEFLEFEGKKYPVNEGGEGLPQIVHAFRLNGTSWELIETKASNSGADYSIGVRALDASSDLAERTPDLLTPHTGGDEIKQPALLAKLTAILPAEDRDVWVSLTDAAAPVYVYQVSGEFIYSTGVVRFQDGESLVAPAELGYTQADFIAALSRGDYLLIAASRIGAHPRLYNVKTRELVYKSDTARAAAFWPR